MYGTVVDHALGTVPDIIAHQYLQFPRKEILHGVVQNIINKIKLMKKKGKEHNYLALKYTHFSEFQDRLSN